MAKVTSGQRSSIKVVICESYKPDTTFRDNEGYGSNPAFSSMPVECTLMELHRTLWETAFITEYQWFLAHFIGDVPYCTIAELAGLTCGQHVEDGVDDMLDDAVYRMPEWLATKCLGIYTVFFRESSLPKEPQQRAKRGACHPNIALLTF
jgi:hypothetical protein